MNSNFGNQTRIDNVNTTNDNSSNTSTVYICGCKFYFILACGCDNDIRPKENIQCKECSGRIFYKKRTRRLVQYEAR